MSDGIFFFRRNLCQILVIAIASGAALLLGTQAQSMDKTGETQTLTAKRLAIEDREGKERIVLSVSDDVPSVSLRDQNNRSRVAISLLPSGAGGFHVFSETGTPVLEVATQPEGNAQVMLFDQSGKISAVVAACAKGVSGFALYDAKDHTLAGMLSTADSTRVIRLGDARGRPKAEILCPKAGPAVAYSLDKNGRKKPLCEVAARHDD
ncbi:MAG: hypothetical protein U1A27_10050 [Phycisphaerae bacterium]